MTPTHKRRLIATVLMLTGVSVASAIAFYSLQENLLYFQSPIDVQETGMPAGRQFRLGGVVTPGSVNRIGDSLATRFEVSDGLAQITVKYEGTLPDLFREGQGVIARGSLDGEGLFEADEVLAKHDENYMPPEVADALEKTGHQATSAQGY